jgi:hypothetical protein
MASSKVFIGYWENFSANGTDRFVLTLPERSAGYLISILTLIISITGTFSWGIIAYALHQMRVSHGRDISPVQLQLQILLRNAKSLPSAMSDSISILRAWWKVKVINSKFRLHVCGIVILSTVLSLGFTTAGIAISSIANTSEQEIIALAQADQCVFWNWNVTVADQEAWGLFVRFTVDTTLRARNYAKSWYTNNPSVAAPQSMFPVKTLPFTTYSAPCPFQGANRCISNDSQNPAFVLDTGLLTTDIHFGVNTQADRTMQLRRVSSCAVINSHDITEHRAGDFFILHAGSYPGYPDGILVFPGSMRDDLLPYTVRLVNGISND